MQNSSYCLLWLNILIYIFIKKCLKSYKEIWNYIVYVFNQKPIKLFMETFRILLENSCFLTICHTPVLLQVYYVKLANMEANVKLTNRLKR